MAEHLKIANTGFVARQIGDWADTEAAQDILRSLDLVRSVDSAAITMVAGAPGTGKTTALKRFCDGLGDDAIYIQAARGEGTAWNVAKAIAAVWGYSAPRFNTLQEARNNLASYIGKGRMLLIDEAQYLNQKDRRTGQTGEALEWLRATAETGGFDLVFCGDLTLSGAVEAMPQLQSRMLRPVIIKQASRADVSAIVEGTAFATERAIDALLIVAKLKGGLRNVENVTRIAQLFAEHSRPGPEHLKAAIADMKLAPKGGR